MAEYVKISWIRSAIGRSYKQKRAIRALGFKRLHQSRVFEDNPSLRGMIRNLGHLLTVEPVAGEGETAVKEENGGDNG